MIVAPTIVPSRTINPFRGKLVEKFEEVGQQIADFVNGPTQRMTRLIYPHGTRFVVCGTSGSGKSRAIDFANGILPASEQIAESRDIVREKDPLRAIDAMENPELKYEASMHIAFNVVSSYLAKALEEKGVKVFWLDSGSSGSHWKAEHGTANGHADQILRVQDSTTSSK